MRVTHVRELERFWNSSPDTGDGKPLGSEGGEVSAHGAGPAFIKRLLHAGSILTDMQASRRPGKVGELTELELRGVTLFHH